MRYKINVKTAFLIFVMVISTLTCLFSVQVVFADSSEEWPSFRNDSANTGYSTSTAPLTNQTLWNYTTGDSVYASPAVAGGVVYVGSGDYIVYALNASDGAQIWNYTTGGILSSSPAVAGGVVYVGSWDDCVYALNASDGTQIWNYTTGGDLLSSSAVVGGVVYVGSSDHNLYALNASDGTQIWNYTTGNTVQDSPAVVGGVVYVGSNDNLVYALNASDGTQIWNYTTGADLLSSPAVADGVVYVGSDDDLLYALNASDGAQIWNYTTGSFVQSSPAVANGVVYIGSNDYIVYALNASDGAQIWNYTTGGVLYSSPAVAGGVVYVGTFDYNLYALNASDGTQIWKYTTGDWVYSSPAVAGGVVYVGSLDSNVYAFGQPPMYTVEFTQSGLDSGTSWSVTFNGTLKASTTDTISFSAPNGDYSYSVSTPSGYTSSSQLTGTVTVADANITKNIVFTKNTPPPAQPYYQLTIYVVGNGTVTPSNHTYLSGTNVDLIAVADQGWTFTNWTGDATGTENTTVVMDSNKVVTATFTQNKYTLTILVVGEGTVTPTSGTYTAGTSVTLEATATEGWTFSEWSGDATGTTNPTVVTMDSNKVVTATFTEQEVVPEFPSIILLSGLVMLASIMCVILRQKITKQT